MPQAKKLIEVALPLDAINRASAREKSIRHGYPSTLHLWWARRPLVAARAVIFTSLVDDPDDPHANPAFVAACNALPGDGPNVKAKDDSPRMRLFDFIERLVTGQYVASLIQLARGRIRLGLYDVAIECLTRAQTYPPNLGEGKLLTVPENDVFFHLGLANELCGDAETAHDPNHLGATLYRQVDSAPKWESETGGGNI